MRMTEADIQITRARPADAAAVRELIRRAYAKWVPVIGWEPVPMRADHDIAVREHLVDLVVADDEYVALIEMIENVDHMLIENLAVTPAFQGNGLGRLLAGHAEALAASLGYKEIRLRSDKAFAENIRLCSSLGYTVYREEPRKGGSIVHMRKMLHEPAITS
jgi:GNAT superfamily N-acetyltransferase